MLPFPPPIPIPQLQPPDRDATAPSFSSFGPYADVEDTAINTLVKQPVAAYVEKVHEEASFAGLWIG